MFRRRQAKTQGRLMIDEFNESLEHLRLAVGHAAGGAADLVGPKLETARTSVKPGVRKANRATAATVVPLAIAARSGVRSGLRGGTRHAEQAAKAARKGAKAARKGALRSKAKLMREEPRMRRWPMMLGGLLVAGAAVGAAGAIIARRRANRDQWEEYGSTRSTGRTDALIESAKTTVDSGRDKVQSLADSAKDRAAEMTGKSTSNAPRTSGSSSSEFGSREDLYGKAGSNNSRS
jgi:hypothetical protein